MLDWIRRGRLDERCSNSTHQILLHSRMHGMSREATETTQSCNTREGPLFWEDIHWAIPHPNKGVTLCLVLQNTLSVGPEGGLMPPLAALCHLLTGRVLLNTSEGDNCSHTQNKVWHKGMPVIQCQVTPRPPGASETLARSRSVLSLLQPAPQQRHAGHSKHPPQSHRED